MEIQVEQKDQRTKHARATSERPYLGFVFQKGICSVALILHVERVSPVKGFTKRIALGNERFQR